MFIMFTTFYISFTTFYHKKFAEHKKSFYIVSETNNSFEHLYN